MMLPFIFPNPFHTLIVKVLRVIVNGLLTILETNLGKLVEMGPQGGERSRNPPGIAGYQRPLGDLHIEPYECCGILMYGQETREQGFLRCIPLFERGVLLF